MNYGTSKRLGGNEIEIVIGIPTIESRASNILKDKGNGIRDYMNPWHRGSTDKIFIEYVGSNMDVQVPLLDIGERVSRSYLHSSRTRRVCTLKIR